MPPRQGNCSGIHVDAKLKSFPLHGTAIDLDKFVFEPVSAFEPMIINNRMIMWRIRQFEKP